MQLSANKKNNTPVAKTQNGKSCLIAYFNMDTLESQYDFAKEVQVELKKVDLDAQNKIAQKQNESNRELRELQEKFKDIDPSNITPAQQTAYMQAQKRVQQLNEELQGFKQEISSKSSETFRNKLTEMKNKIEAYLKEYNRNNTYAFIFANTDNIMYYKDSAFDITNDIIKGLNEEHKKKK